MGELNEKKIKNFLIAKNLFEYNKKKFVFFGKAFQKILGF